MEKKLVWWKNYEEICEIEDRVLGNLKNISVAVAGKEKPVKLSEFDISFVDIVRETAEITPELIKLKVAGFIALNNWDKVLQATNKVAQKSPVFQIDNMNFTILNEFKIEPVFC